jgi:hypothetical protein
MSHPADSPRPDGQPSPRPLDALLPLPDPPGVDDLDDTMALAIEALNDLAEELPLEVILLELRDFYRRAHDDEFTRVCPEYHHICDVSLRALDSALWRLETANV